jgi:hypothetical protein
MGVFETFVYSGLQVYSTAKSLVATMKMKQTFFSDFTENELLKAAHFSKLS